MNRFFITVSIVLLFVSLGLLGYVAWTYFDQMQNITITSQESPSKPAPTWPRHDLFEQTDKNNLENYPDIFLSTRMPYESETFAITSEYDDVSEMLVFSMTTKIKDKNKAKQEMFKWLQGLGLSLDQIESLKIIYK